MHQGNTSFPAKLLLFGEYTVLSGSQALARPVFQFEGKWVNPYYSSHLFDVGDFIDYLKSLKDRFPAIAPERIQALQEDYEEGYYYFTNIPIGYGLGSSGALCAGIFSRYFNIKDASLPELREHLAALESYFHGNSSGMDPLVSYLKCPILKEGSNYHVISLPHPDPKQLSIGLLDSENARNTGTLVAAYQKLSSQRQFRRQCILPLSNLVNEAAHYYISGHWELVLDYGSLISSMQFEWFPPMIPQDLKPAWKQCLGSSDTVIKFCGAGGGGFFLIFSSSRSEAKARFEPFNITWLEG